MNRLSRFACERGFTLLEAIVAMFILTVGILAVAAIQGQCHQGKYGRLRTNQANNIATALIETSYLQVYSTLPNIYTGVFW